MKRNFVKFLALSAAISLSSCYKDDIEGLQNDLKDLQEEVAELEAAQKAALLEQIAALQAQIATLENENDALAGSLEDLTDEVANNEAAIYYGNLLTDADFAKFREQGASVVTGNVAIGSDTHMTDAAMLKLVGGSLKVSGGSDVSLAMLENVAGSVMIEMNDATSSVAFPALLSTGSHFIVRGSAAVASVSAPELTLIYGDFEATQNDMLATLDFPMLDKVNGNLTLMGAGFAGGGEVLTSVEFSSADVGGNIYVNNLAGGIALNLGVAGGDVTFANNGFDSFELLNETIPGTLTVEGNIMMSTMSLPNLTAIGGGLNIVRNAGGGFIGAGTSELKDLSAFANLESIGGDAIIEWNMFETLDAFNNVTSFLGNRISIQHNGNDMSLVEVFNGLEQAGEYSWSTIDVTLKVRTDAVRAFEKLDKVNNLAFEARVTFDANWESGTVCDVNAFNAITRAEKIEVNLGEVTSIDGFNELEELRSNDAGYIYITMPADASVELCSFNKLFDQIYVDPTMGRDWSERQVWLVNPNTYDLWADEMDETTGDVIRFGHQVAIDTYTSACQ